MLRIERDIEPVDIFLVLRALLLELHDLHLFVRALLLKLVHLAAETLHLGGESIDALLEAGHLDVVLGLLAHHRLHRRTRFDLARNHVLQRPALLVDDPRVFALHLRDLALRRIRVALAFGLLLDQLRELFFLLAEAGLDAGRTLQCKLMLLLGGVNLVFAFAQSGSETLGVLLFVMELSLKL